MLRPARPPTPTLSPALGPTRDRQKPDRALPHTRELCGQAPPGERCLFTLALQTLPMLPPLQGLPPCWHCHLPPGPRLDSAKSQPRPSPCVCVCMCVVLPLPPPLAGDRTRTACVHTLGLGHTLELLPELDLMQTFLCLLGRGTSEGPGSKPVGLRATAGWGAAPGFRHTTPTRACAHACLVCHITGFPLPRTHVMLYTWRPLTSLTPSISPHLPLTCCPSPTHPGTPKAPP